MTKPVHLRVSDLRGFHRLASEATVGLTDLVEAMHHTIARIPGVLGESPKGRTSGITGLVYKSVRGVTRLVGDGVDALLGGVASLIAERPSSQQREAVVAALNGVLGDYLVASANPLAITMCLRAAGRPLPTSQAELTATFPDRGHKVLVLLHGLCMNDLQWGRDGHDHGAALARDLGYTPVYLHYNTGRHISTNGRKFADVMETILQKTEPRAPFFSSPSVRALIPITARRAGGLTTVSSKPLRYDATFFGRNGSTFPITSP